MDYMETGIHAAKRRVARREAAAVLLQALCRPTEPMKLLVGMRAEEAARQQRLREERSAVTIQRWHRGCLARVRVKLWHVTGTMRASMCR